MTGGILPQQMQLFFCHHEFRKAATHADPKIGEHPNYGFVDILQSENVDTHLTGKLCLILRPTRSTRHMNFLSRQSRRPSQSRAGRKNLPWTIRRTSVGAQRAHLGADIPAVDENLHYGTNLRSTGVAFRALDQPAR